MFQPWEKTGVYAIYCEAVGKVYIGGTMQAMRKRLDQHYGALRGKRHTCLPLQAAYDEHGIEAFTSCILCFCTDAEDVKASEAEFLVHAHSAGVLFNERHVGVDLTGPVVPRPLSVRVWEWAER